MDTAGPGGPAVLFWKPMFFGQRPVMKLRSRPIFASFLPLSLALLAVIAATGQSRPRRAVRSSTKSVVTPGGENLAGLVAAQRSAVAGGDAGAIEPATRALAAELLREMSQLRFVGGRSGEAVDLARKSILLGPSPETRLELASMLLRTNQPKDAAEEAGLVVAAEPGSAMAWAVRGSALRANGDNQGAVEALKRSLAIKPDVNVAFAMGSALLALREKAKAQRVFQWIIDASQGAAIQHVAAGDAYLEARYLPDAVEEFQKAVAIDPRAGHAEFFLGYAYLQMNEWGPNSESFKHLRAAVRLAPRDYLSNFYLGAIESTDGTDLVSSNQHLHVAAEADPRSPEVWLYLGLNAIKQRNKEDAKTYLRKAIETTGADEARNNYQIRRVYAVLGRLLVSEGNHAEGDALLAKYRASEHRAIGNSSDVIARAAGEGEAHSEGGPGGTSPMAFPGMNSPQPPGSIAPITIAAAVNHTADETRKIAATEHELSELLADGFNDLGTAEARQSRYKEALGHFEEAERWRAATPELLHNIGVAAFRIGDYKESARALGEYLAAVTGEQAHSAQADRSRMMLAMSLFSEGLFAEADKAFAQTAALTMADPRAAYSWAFSMAHAGQQQHANEVAAELAQQTLSADVRSLVCHIFMDTENYEQSLKCYRNAYTLDASVRLAHYQAGESLIRLDRPAEALAEYRQELTLQPDNADVRYAVAFALLQSGQRTEAMEMLRSAIAALPTQAQAQYQLGKALLEDGKAAEAVEHLEVSEKSDPDPDYVHYQLQAAYRKLGRTADADRELQIYRDIKERNRGASTPKPSSVSPR